MSELDPHPEEAAAILRAARERALGARPGLRLLAITAWSSFLGAVVLLAAWLLALPGDGETIEFENLALVFVVLWALAAIPALSAALLAQPSPGAFDPPHQR
ncbi:MAG: hypothetical protein PHP86_09995 [Nevskiales bacterium]|nr:hypothetical protein [Nevskiales bacterium]